MSNSIKQYLVKSLNYIEWLDIVGFIMWMEVLHFAVVIWCSCWFFCFAWKHPCYCPHLVRMRTWEIPIKLFTEKSVKSHIKHLCLIEMWLTRNNKKTRDEKKNVQQDTSIPVLRAEDSYFIQGICANQSYRERHFFLSYFETHVRKLVFLKSLILMRYI